MPPSGRPVAAAFVVVGAGIAAALHVGKLAPAVPALRTELGVTLVEAGFLLSLVQFAGMLGGAVFGVVADAAGGRRSVVAGLVVLAAASLAGGEARGAGALMALRALEGFGFLLVVLPAPGLLRRLVAADRLPGVLGLWGSYMPLATALALLAGPAAIDAFGWPAWWRALGIAAAAAAVVVAAVVPADGARPAIAGWRSRLARTLGARGPWLLAATFATYSAQWLAVIGFLPTIYRQAGLAGAAVGAATALAAAVNAIGNLGAGRLRQRGMRAERLLQAGFATMALAAGAAFADLGLPPSARYSAVLVFSAVGGLVPATLFTLAVRVAPGDDAVATTVGWMQQGSAFGQFAGPPIVAAVAAARGGWQWTGVVTALCAGLGMVLAMAIGALLRERGAPGP